MKKLVILSFIIFGLLFFRQTDTFALEDDETFLWCESHVDCPLTWYWRQGGRDWELFSDGDGLTNCEYRYVSMKWGTWPDTSTDVDLKMVGCGIEATDTVRMFAGSDTDYLLSIKEYPGSLWGEQGYIACPPHREGCAIEQVLGNDQESIKLLRRFRDEVLSKSKKGKAMIKFYYEKSPQIVELIEKNPVLKEQCKTTLIALMPSIKKAVNKNCGLRN